MSALAKKPKTKKVKKTILYANVSHTKYPTVKNCLMNLGYKFTDSDTKNMLFWGDNEGTLEFVKHLETWQFYNHFPGMWKIAHKVELVRNYDRLQKLIPEYYNFHPNSFVIPSQLSDLKSFMSTIQKRNERTFIIKPDKGSQGKGIFLIQDFEDLHLYFESAVAQQYISPFLVDGFKFDLRIYVLVTSVDPLRLYIHEEGMARFCTEPYSPPTHSNLDNCYSHLTNFSLNKKNENFTDRSKRPKSEVFEQIRKSGADIQQIQNEIDDIIRFTLISNQPNLAANYRTAINASDGKSRLFEILGFDILIDNNCHPWLIELNSMPSLSTGSEFDLKLKTSVIDGALRILDLKPSFKRTCVARTRKAITQRISGVGDSLPSLFNPDKETQISMTTNWRQIYPIDDEAIMKKCEIALEKTREAPIGGVNETAAFRMRREANVALVNKNSQSSLSLQSIQSTQSEKSSPKLIKPTNSNISKLQKNEDTRSDRSPSVKPRLPVKAPRKILSVNNTTSVKSPPSSQQQEKDNKKSSIVKSTSILNQRRFSLDASKQKNDVNINHSLLNKDSVVDIEVKSPMSAVRTPRGVSLANEARKSRMIAMNAQNQLKNGNCIMNLHPFVPSTINEVQEKERVLALRRREAESMKVNMLQKINTMLISLNSMSPSNNNAKKTANNAKKKVAALPCKVANIVITKSNC